MAKITISEGIGLLKTLKERHDELVGLRNENSYREKRYLGANADKTTERTPVYNVKKLDKLINQVAMELRKLDAAIKAANASMKLEYEWDEAKLGTVE